MTEERPQYVTSTTPVIDGSDPLAGLSRAERDAVLAMRRIGFGTRNREETLVLRWNGVRLIPLETSQITI